MSYTRSNNYRDNEGTFLKVTDDDFVNWVMDNKSKMYRFALSVVRNPADAEDAVCEAISKGYEHLDSLKDAEKLSSWMMTILYNVSKTMYVKRKREIAIEDTTIPEMTVENNHNELNEVVSRLKKNLKVVVVLYYYMGYHTKEIAKILGIREGTVKSRLSRARDELRKMLENEAM